MWVCHFFKIHVTVIDRRKDELIQNQMSNGLVIHINQRNMDI